MYSDNRFLFLFPLHSWFINVVSIGSIVSILFPCSDSSWFRLQWLQCIPMVKNPNISSFCQEPVQATTFGIFPLSSTLGFVEARKETWKNICCGRSLARSSVIWDNMGLIWVYMDWYGFKMAVQNPCWLMMSLGIILLIIMGIISSSQNGESLLTNQDSME